MNEITRSMLDLLPDEFAVSEETKRTRDPMPDEFASRAEVAEFWDTHDITDYLDVLEPVDLKFSEHLAHGVVVRFESDTLTKVYETAREQGITMDALIQQWVVERLESQSGVDSTY